LIFNLNFKLCQEVKKARADKEKVAVAKKDRANQQEALPLPAKQREKKLQEKVVKLHTAVDVQAVAQAGMKAADF
jgi:hypothetical protein